MIVNCPHCYQMIWIEELNCRIFRCGIIKKTGEQIPPHSTKKDCEIFVSDGVYGCAKPFKINEKNQVEKCDYI